VALDHPADAVSERNLLFGEVHLGRPLPFEATVALQRIGT
jgi:hypothetical protein